MATKQKLLGAAAGFGTDDPDFKHTTLLLDFDGTSDDDNNTFTDSGSLGGTVTATGDVVQGSFSPYGDNWSNYFSGASTEYLSVSDAIDFDFGTGDFTVECFFYETGQTGGFTILGATDGTNNYFGYGELTGTPDGMSMYAGSAGTDIYSGSSSIPQPGQWNHLVWQRSSGRGQMYLNGTRVYDAVYSADFGSSASGFRVGRSSSYSNYYAEGYVSNFRVVNGEAVYSGSTITVPTAPLTNGSYSNANNLRLLTCHSNRFKDDGTDQLTVTVNGTPKVTPFGPFQRGEDRTLTTDGGSANFNQDELLTIADNSALDVSGAMTAECWMYVTDMPDNNIGNVGQGYLINRWTASGNQRSWMFVYGNNGDIAFYSSSTGGSSYTISTATGAISTYRWLHVAASWDGTNQRLFIDGDLKVTTSNTSGPFSTPNSGFTVNSINTSLTGTNINQYIADARYFPDRAIYTESFTPPTEPLGSIQGVANTLIAPVYESKSFSFSGQEGNTQGVAFKTDGTKMYVVGTGTDRVYQYSLSTAWDVSTASYDSVSLDVSSEDTIPYGIAFSTNGEKLYVVGGSNDNIYQYNLSTAWDLSTASYSNNSVATQGSDPFGVFVHSSGTSIYDVDSTDDKVYQYDMTTAYDLSTASYASKSASVGGNSHGVAFSADGTKMFVCRQATNVDLVEQYTLSTAWDVSTASSDNLDFDVSSESVNPSDIQLKPDGTKLYMLTNAADNVYQYSLTDSYDPAVMLNFQDAGIFDRTGINNIDTVGDARLGFAPIYGLRALAFDGTGDYIEASYVGDVFDFDTSDWTLECWVYLQADSDGSGGIIEIYKDDNNFIRLFRASGPDIQLRGSSGGTQQFDIQSSAQSQNTWIHVAGVRDGSTIRLFVDGTQVGTDTSFSIPDLSDARVLVGLDLVATDRYFTGYIDDLRVTKGVARYTSDFTPPTEINLATDTHREYVTLFLTGEGPVNGQNNTFTDSSTNDFTITKNGSVAQGVFSPYGDNWSNYFEGTNDYLTFSSVTAAGTGDVTVEFWFWASSEAATYRCIYDSRSTTGTDTGFGIFQYGKVIEVYGNGKKVETAADAFNGNEWVHFALVRSSGSCQIYINGTASGSSATYSDNLTSTARIVGDSVNTSYDYYGYISNLRETHTAVYTSNFTAPTAPLTAVTNTKLLTCAANRFVDESAGDHSLTPNGNVAVTRFSPFESNKPYDITTDGGSGYFDLSTSYLTYSGGSSSVSDITISFWVYVTGSMGTNGGLYPRIFASASGALLIYTRDDDIRIYNGGEKLQTPITQNEWHHFVAQRTSSTWEMWLDGDSKGTASDSTAVNLNTTNYIGRDTSNAGYFGGYISDFKITEGSEGYSGNFTPPSSPVSAGSSDLLLSFQDSAIPDLSGINNIDTVGDAKVAGSDPTKYGSNSLQLDETGDYLTVPSTDDIALGTGDFTIECWVYFTAVATNGQGLFQFSSGYLNSQDGIGPAIGTYNGTGKWHIYYGASSNSTSTVGSAVAAPSQNTWYHVAYVRTSGVIKIFIDGTQIGSDIAFTGDYTNTYLTIGGWYSTSYLLNGFIDDFRITKGVARYTANFTPPIKALPKH